jgi:hypothetical protein
MFNGTLNVPLSFLQSFSTCRIVSKNHSKKILSITRSIEVSNALKSSSQMMKLSTNLSKTLGVNNMSKTNEKQDPYSRMPS